MRALLDLKVPQVTEAMIANCARYLAALVKDPTADNIIIGAFDSRLKDTFIQAISELHG